MHKHAATAQHRNGDSRVKVTEDRAEFANTGL